MIVWNCSSGILHFHLFWKISVPRTCRTVVSVTNTILWSTVKTLWPLLWFGIGGSGIFWLHWSVWDQNCDFSLVLFHNGESGIFWFHHYDRQVFSKIGGGWVGHWTWLMVERLWQFLWLFEIAAVEFCISTIKVSVKCYIYDLMLLFSNFDPDLHNGYMMFALYPIALVFLKHFAHTKQPWTMSNNWTESS